MIFDKSPCVYTWLSLSRLHSYFPNQSLAFTIMPIKTDLNCEDYDYKNIFIVIDLMKEEGAHIFMSKIDSMGQERVNFDQSARHY